MLRTWLSTIGTACLLLAHATSAPAQSPSAGLRIHVGPNLRASGTDTLERNESWLAVSQTNPRVLVAVSQIYRPISRGCVAMVSHDAGNTWREVALPGDQDCFDPMVIAAPDGRFHILNTTFAPSRRVPEGFGLRSEAPIRIFTSSDDGRTWRGPADLRTPVHPDHPRLGVDLSDGPYRGRVYVAWNEISATFLRDRYHIFLNHSDDGGATFSEPTLLQTDSGGKLVTTEPLVLSDGTLLVTYYQYFQPLTSRRNERQPVYLLRSSDGGRTFGPREKIFEVGMAAWPDRKAEFPRAFTLPLFAADVSRTSRHRDRIYAVWDDVSDGESNIWLTWSSDQGRTWSAKRRVNDNVPGAAGGLGELRVTPVVAVNPDGVVAVVWYDRRDDVTRRCWKKYIAASSDGGVTFSSNAAISSVPSCPPANMAPTVFVRNATPDSTLPPADSVDALVRDARFAEAGTLGEALARREADAAVAGPRLRVSFDRSRGLWPGHYTGITADTSGTFHALWSDRRTGHQGLYYARVDVAGGAVPARPTLVDTTVSHLVSVVASNPTFDEATGEVTVDLQLHNASGRPVHAPLRVRPLRAVAGATSLSAAVRSGAGATSRGVTEWDFSSALGTRGRLDPGVSSEVRRVTIRGNTSLGLDVAIDFTVLGRLEKP